MKNLFTYVLSMIMVCCIGLTANAQTEPEGPEVTDFEAVLTDTEGGDSASVVFTLTFSEAVELAPVHRFVIHHIKGQDFEELEMVETALIELDENVATVSPASVLSKNGTYEFVLTAGSVRNGDGVPNTSFREIFHRDTMRPVLTEISPDLDAAVPGDAVFSFTFNEDVRILENFGFFTYIWNAETEVFDEFEAVDPSLASVEGNVVTVDPSMDLPAGERVQIVLNSGSVRDFEGNSFLYVRAEEDTVFSVSRRFWIAEDGEVQEVTFTPAHEDTLTTIPESVTIAFNRNVTVHDTIDVETLGYDTLVYLKQGDEDIDFEATFDEEADVLTIVPAEPFTFGNAYTYGFNPGFLDDEGADIEVQEVTFVLTDPGATDEYDAIADIRGENDEVPMDGEEVMISGTITGVYAEEGFYVQDDNAVRSGIWVQYATTEELEVGDGVIVSGVVDVTDYGITVVADEVTETEATLTVEPQAVTFENDSLPMYTGVVVSLAGLRASAANVDNDWSLFTENDMDSVLVSGQMFGYEYVADNLYDLTGIVTFRDSVYRIEPRAEADVIDVTDPTSVDPSLAADINIYPNPFREYVRISNHDKVSRVVISNIAGQRVLDLKNPQSQISTSRLVSGVYIVNLYNDRDLIKTSRIVKQ